MRMTILILTSIRWFLGYVSRVYGVKAQEIFDRLNASNIKNSTGRITFEFDSIEVVIKEKSSIGYLFQEWLESWLDRNAINFRTPENSQEFPDLFLSPDSDTTELLEIKTFDSNASANFDVANFDAYHRSLQTKAYRLDADYLIFSYTHQNYVFSVKDIWLKKIWEITSVMKDRPLRIQNKQGVIHNIRPASWYSSRATYKPFNSRRDFVKALHEMLLQYEKTESTAQDWFEIVEENYRFYTGSAL